MTLLDVRDVGVSYGKARVLLDVNVTLAYGEILGLIGPNGAGKTTLLNALSGLVAYTGTIRFRDAPLPTRPEAIVRQGLIHCPEGRNLFPHLSVADNLRLGAYTRGDPEAIETDLEAVYALFPALAERKRQWVHALSGGQQQMVAIGRALMGRPTLLILDEPTLGLAPVMREAIADSLPRIREEFGLSLLVAEQNAAFAFALADRLYLLETGRIVQEGTPTELRADERVRSAYLGR